MLRPRIPERAGQSVVYYRGRMSGVIPLVTTAWNAVFAGICLGVHTLLAAGPRQLGELSTDPDVVALLADLNAGLQASPDLVRYMQMCLLAMVCIFGLRCMWTWIGWSATTYTVTNERIQFEQGVLTKTIKTIELWRVRDLIFRRDAVEAVFGLGSITVVANDPTSRYSIIGPVYGGRRLFYELMEARYQAVEQRGVSAVES
ncbi:MAG: PH domain-containing protein [Pirellulaceae bacterium]